MCDSDSVSDVAREQALDRCTVGTLARLGAPLSPTSATQQVEKRLSAFGSVVLMELPLLSEALAVPVGSIVFDPHETVRLYTNRPLD